MNFCASWYPTVVESTPATAVDKRSSPLASDSESSTTARKPNPIGFSDFSLSKVARVVAGAAAVAPFFVRPLDFDNALTAEEEDEEEKEEG
jgi:hypothetical protein